MSGKFSLDIKKEEGDAPFNMAMLFYIRLSELLNAKDRAAINQDYAGWYSALKQIYNNIYWNIKKTEKLAVIEKNFKSAFDYLNAAMPINRRCANSMQGMINGKLVVVLELIDRDIMILLDSKKMIFPRIDEVIGLQKIREQYKL